MSETIESNDSHSKTFCEFFAGIGLVREGLCDSGWQCVYANDIDPRKQAQYLARFGDKHFHLEDVGETQSVLSMIHGTPLLATASFPCTDLSVAGKRRGLQGEHSSTFFGFADVIAAMKPHQPKLIMLENVAGFLTSHGGQDFRAAVTSLAELGYYVDCIMVDAKHFVPQSRVRVFVIGIHESVVEQCSVVRSVGAAALWKDSIRCAPSLRPKRVVQLMDSIHLPTGWVVTSTEDPLTQRQDLEELIDTDHGQDWWGDAQVDKHFQMMSDIHKEDVRRRMGERDAVHVGTIFRRRRYGEMRAEIRFDGLAGCLRVPRGGSARQIVILVNKGELRIRWMSPREYARLKGTPDFPLVGTATQQMAGFGDAVCVPVIRWIDDRILTPLCNAITE